SGSPALNSAPGPWKLSPNHPTDFDNFFFIQKVIKSRYTIKGILTPTKCNKEEILDFLEGGWEGAKSTVHRTTSIECGLPGIDPTNLSCDQKYLLDIWTTTSSGVCSSDLAKNQPGTLILASWLTTANRILRFYTSTSDPSNELLTLVAFILRVYATSWLRIKVHHSIKNGAKHLWHFISSSRKLTKKHRDIIEPVISRKAYFAVQENMLLSMLTDERC
ncbi:hypothetical protein AVEN_37215-1, partial [Araneus ventricosus]